MDENIDYTRCCVCGIRIYVESDHMKTLKNTHKDFYCINGHEQRFTGKSEAEQQKDLNKIIQHESNKRIDELKRKIVNLKETMTPPHKCPTCNKTYSSKGNLNVHLKKHKKN